MRACAVSGDSELASDEREALLSTLELEKFSGRHLEIGTAAGGTLWQMMQKLPKNHSHPFVVVDPMKYFPLQLEKVKSNLIEHGIDLSRVDFRVKTSEEAYLEAENRKESYDFIFIDGNHKFRYVMRDLRWANFLNEGGIVALHDYGPAYPGVKKAVDLLLKRFSSFQVISQVRDLIILKKQKAVKKNLISSLDLLWADISTPLMQLQRSIQKKF